LTRDSEGQHSVRINQQWRICFVWSADGHGFVSLRRSTAVLRRVVVDQAFPLELKVPNAKTQAAMQESRSMMARRKARFASSDEVFSDLEENSDKYARQRAAA
jgi:hypothetical protein